MPPLGRYRAGAGRRVIGPQDDTVWFEVARQLLPHPDTGYFGRQSGSQAAAANIGNGEYIEIFWRDPSPLSLPEFRHPRHAPWRRRARQLRHRMDSEHAAIS